MHIGQVLKSIVGTYSFSACNLFAPDLHLGQQFQNCCQSECLSLFQIDGQTE